MNTATWGDFEVRFDQELGRGGMGVVYRARQISLDRPVAIKVLDPTRTDDPEAFLERFRVEALAVGRIRDPRIVGAIQAGRNDGKSWIAMELIEGRTVEQRLSEGLLPDAEATRIATEVALALDAARRLGILHRDVKPGNIFLCQDGSVKLGDWGLAKAAEFGPTKLTDPNAITCTPSYVAPEIASGRAADFRSDLYSLGCVLYEMVTERPPFQGGSAVDLLLQHCNEPVEPPGRFNPKLGKALEAAILKCLEKDPDRRYASYDEFVRDLARPVPRARRPRLVGIAVALGAAMFATILYFRPRRPAPEEPAPLRPSRFVPKEDPGIEPRALPESTRPAARWGPDREETREHLMVTHATTPEELAAIRRMWTDDFSNPPTPYVRLLFESEQERRRTGRPTADVARLLRPDPEVYPYLPGLVGELCRKGNRAILTALASAREKYPATLRYAFEPLEALERRVTLDETYRAFEPEHELVGEQEFLAWDGKAEHANGAYSVAQGFWIVRKFEGARRGYRIRFRGKLAVAISPSLWFDAGDGALTLFRLEQEKVVAVERGKRVAVAEICVIPKEGRFLIFADGDFVWSIDAVHDAGLRLGGGPTVIESIRVVERR